MTALIMPECPRCRVAYFEGESHNCRDFRDQRHTAADTFIVYSIGTAIVAIGLAVVTGATSATLSIPGVIVLWTVGLWRWKARGRKPRK